MAKSDSFIFGAELDRLKQLLALGDEAPPEDPGKSPAAATAFDSLVERPGAQRGHYKLLRILGEGGMGVVYLAEQERPVRRQVALKVIKPGMDSRRVLARFEAEQQALALMERPHVARVHDAGLTPSGRPYFVMEYVRGVPVTEYCDTHRVTIEERLRLFLHVCEAVQHAHQKGIIHRDLKPSNILVTTEDGQASPKVIDFGVARAISQPLTERTLCTEQGQLVGTPEYMSPEQADPGSRDIDTRTDIYSLGVVLYELLAVALLREQQARRVAVAAQEKEVFLRRQVQAQAYASDMSLAQQALAINDLGQARRLLEAHRPTPGEPDRRGWEWRYLWQECRSDALGELCRYSNSAYSVAFSPDGKVLAVAGLDEGFVEVWDVVGRHRIKTLQKDQGHLVAFSPQGNLLATDAGNQIQLWRPGTWDPVRPLSVVGGVQVLKFAPDGKRLACLSYPGKVTVWEVDQWTVVRTIPDVRLLGTHGGALDFAPDGRTLVLGGADPRLWTVDLAGGDTKFDIPEAHPEPIMSVAWLPDGSVVAGGSGYNGGPIQLRDAASGKLLGELKGHTSWICELVFSTDGRWLYSAGADQTIRIWDVEHRRPLSTLQGSTDEVYGLAVSPDGATLASASKDGVIAFWNARPRPQKEPFRLVAAGPSVRPAFAPDGRVLAVPRAGTVNLLDLATGEEIEQLPALGDEVSTVVYSPDGTVLVGGREGEDPRMVLYAASPARRIARPLYSDLPARLPVRRQTLALGRAGGEQPGDRVGYRHMAGRATFWGGPGARHATNRLTGWPPPGRRDHDGHGALARCADGKAPGRCNRQSPSQGLRNRLHWRRHAGRQCRRGRHGGVLGPVLPPAHRGVQRSHAGSARRGVFSGRAPARHRRQWSRRRQTLGPGHASRATADTPRTGSAVRICGLLSGRTLAGRLQQRRAAPPLACSAMG
jgi:WD40 repeat protein/predicted Ser/Thr protein kinase